MPGILKLFMVMCGLLGVFSALACLAFLVAVSAGSGPYMVQGAMVSREEFMAFAVPALGGQIVLGGFAAAAAWGLFRRRYWARPLLLGTALSSFLFSLLGGAVLGIPWRQVWLAMLTGGLASLFLWWVLYRRDDVADWFASLREDQR
jgi:hypothetical protein